jgi:UDPglucose 6-dehydrogenase
MKISIYGYGFVGKAHYELLKGIERNIIDPQYKELEKENFDTEAAIVCVSTPSRADGSCEMKNVFEVIESIDKETPILIKSTISLEGWRMLKKTFPDHKITFSPEYLRAANYVEDLKNLTHMHISTDNAEYWANFFHKFYSDIRFIVASAEELILVKYFRNAFLATKVSFFNQIYDLCKKENINYDSVAAGIGQDARIGQSHTLVDPSERGWGGHCFPKDTKAIVSSAEKIGVELSLIKEAIEYNHRIRK